MRLKEVDLTYRVATRAPPYIFVPKGVPKIYMYKEI